MQRIAVCFLMHSFAERPQYLFYKLKKDLCEDDRYKVFAMLETSSLSQNINKFEYDYGSYCIDIPTNIHTNDFDDKLKFGISKDNSLLFTWDDMIKKYRSIKHGPSYVGNCCYPFLELYHKLEERKEHFDYFIFIEDDIIYTGDYKELFDKIQIDKYDFVRYENKIADFSWYWFNEHKRTNKFRNVFGNRKLVHGLLQLYSLSNKAIKFLYDEITQNQYLAHHELLVSTLLENNDNLTKHTYANDIPTHIYVYEHELNNFLNSNPFRKNELYHPIKQVSYLSKAINA